MKKQLHTKYSDTGNKYIIGVLIIIVTFLLTRLHYYLYYPVADVSADSASYCAIALKLLNLELPLMDMRTPGYPAFLALTLFLSKNFIVTYFFQSILSLASALFLYHTFSLYYRSLSVYFAIAISIFISSSFCIVLELSVLSESMFVSFLLISFSFLINSLKTAGKIYLIYFSISISALILIRPVALFFLPALMIMIIYFYLNKFKINCYVSLLLPLSILMILFCSYNYFTLNKFTISPAGDLSFFACTILYMEESPDYPPAINTAIKNTLDSIPRKEKAYVKEPKEITKLNRIFNDNLFRSWRFVGEVMKQDSSLSYMDIYPYLVRISRDAVKKYPEVFLRIVASNIYQFLRNISEEMLLFSQLTRSYKRIYVEGYYISILNDEYWDQFYSDKASVKDVSDLYRIQTNEYGSFSYVSYENENVIFQDTMLKQIYTGYEKISNFIFRNLLWLVLFSLTFLYSTYKVIKYRFRDTDSFLIFIFCMIFIFNVLFISILGTSIARYSYTIEIIVYLSLPFMILLLKKPNSLKLK